MRSQFIDRRARSERTVAVEISERGGAENHKRIRAAVDFDAVEGVRGASLFHEHWPHRRPYVLEIEELSMLVARYEIHIACERPNVRSQFIDR